MEKQKERLEPWGEKIKRRGGPVRGRSGGRGEERTKGALERGRGIKKGRKM